MGKTDQLTFDIDQNILSTRAHKNDGSWFFVAGPYCELLAFQLFATMSILHQFYHQHF